MKISRYIQKKKTNILIQKPCLRYPFNHINNNHTFYSVHLTLSVSYTNFVFVSTCDIKKLYLYS